VIQTVNKDVILILAEMTTQCQQPWTTLYSFSLECYCQKIWIWIDLILDLRILFRYNRLLEYSTIFFRKFVRRISWQLKTSRMHGKQFTLVIIAVSVYIISAPPTPTTIDDLDGACEVRNQLIEYDINGHVSTINVPECVVSTAYVIRSTITSDPADQARFIEINHGCCCQVAKFTKRQIRIGHIIHKYNEIESCACRPCDFVGPIETAD